MDITYVKIIGTTVPIIIPAKLVKEFFTQIIFFPYVAVF
ncbi:hypothetical protein S2E19_01672 [Bacillus mycoides]|nr:hypothetical protein S2E19_01672 [Bacillus mycoides]